MCVIVAKTKKASLPKLEHLKNCFNYNADGCGFMYVKNNKVIIDKGYMNYADFEKRYKKLCKENNDFKNKNLIIHFRIGTSAENTKEHTHPYPLTNNKKELHKLKTECKVGIVHNGIIADYTPKTKQTNDTQEFIINYLYPLYKNYNEFYKNKYITDGIQTITNSKFVILDNNDNMTMIGDFINEKKVYYSNNTYKTTYSYKWYNYESDYKQYEKDFYNYKDNIKNYGLYYYDTELEKNWYYSINGKEFVKVGDNNIIYNDYLDTLYKYENGNYTEIGNNVIIADENGEEIIL